MYSQSFSWLLTYTNCRPHVEMWRTSKSRRNSDTELCKKAIRILFIQVSANICLDVYVCTLSIIQLPEFQFLHSRHSPRKCPGSSRFSCLLLSIHRKLSLVNENNINLTGTYLLCDFSKMAYYVILFLSLYFWHFSRNLAHKDLFKGTNDARWRKKWCQILMFCQNIKLFRRRVG